MYVKLKDGEPEQFPYSVWQLRNDNSQTSFPKDISNSILETFDVFEVTKLDEPDYDHLVQDLVEGTPVYNNERWEVSYTAVNKSDADAKEAVRRQRNSLLAGTDWMALSDVTLSEAWTTYRQALRNIPLQSGFPANVTWPTKPE